MDEKRIQEIFSDGEFVARLFQMESAAEAQAALKEKGLDVTEEELNQVRANFSATVDQTGELSLDSLDGVAGGSSSNVASIVTSGILIGSGLNEGGVRTLSSSIRW